MENQSRPVTGYPATGYPQPQPNGSSTGTAYPYAAPPPQSAYYIGNPNPYYAQPYPNPRATFLRRLIGIIISSFLVFVTIAFIVWLVLRPRYPDFQVDSVTLSNFNLSSSSITGNWNVGFTVRNPNTKITLYYDQIGASVFYQGESLAETTVAPFVQGKRNQTAVRATFAAASSYVDKGAVTGINGDRTAQGAVTFNVIMIARVRFKAGAWVRRRFLRIYCPKLPVRVPSNSTGGTLNGGPWQCRVGT